MNHEKCNQHLMNSLAAIPTLGIINIIKKHVSDALIRIEDNPHDEDTRRYLIHLEPFMRFYDNVNWKRYCSIKMNRSCSCECFTHFEP